MGVEDHLSLFPSSLFSECGPENFSVSSLSPERSERLSAEPHGIPSREIKDGEVTGLGVLGESIGEVRTILPDGGMPRDVGGVVFLASYPSIIYETTRTSAANTVLGRGYPLAFFPGVPI